MLATTAALGLLLAAVLVPASGETVWVEAAFAGQAWGTTATSPRAGWLLAELEGGDPGLDLDLVLTSPAAGWSRTAASHRPQEWLLVPLEADTPLQIHVAGPPGCSSSFRLGLTRLNEADLPLAGAPVELDPAGPRRALLLRLDGAAEAERTRVTIGRAGWSALPELQLGAFDGAGAPVALATGVARLELPQPARQVVLTWREGLGPLAVRAAVSPRGQSLHGTLSDFLSRLGQTPGQREVLAALLTTPDFVRIRSYLEAYPGGLPIRLQVVPGLRAQGVERFGTYANRALAINPTIAAHRDNAQELVDTLLHELIHAVLSLPRAQGFPFAADVLDSAHDPRLAPLVNVPLRRGKVPATTAAYLDGEYGPSASNPSEDYCDVNAGAQRLIVKVVEDTLRRTRIGHETLVFDSVRARERLRLEAGAGGAAGAAKK